MHRTRFSGPLACPSRNRHFPTLVRLPKAREERFMAGHSTPTVVDSPPSRSRVAEPQRRLTAVVVGCVVALLAGFVAVTPAYAATAPVVTNPGAQISPTKLALSLTMMATGGTTPFTWSAT